MGNTRNWLKRRWFTLTCLLLVALMLGMTGVNITDRDSVSGNRISIGVGDEKVITLGSVALAAGTVDYEFDGVADDIQFQAAMDALPAAGGRLVVVSATQVNFTALTTVTRAIGEVTIEGSGLGTTFVGDGVTAIFTAGGNNWVFENMAVDAGSIAMGATTGWMWTNVLDNATFYAYRSPYGQSVVNDLTAASIGAYTLSGKLTAGASEIEGSTFDINGGDISAATVSGGLTWSSAQNFGAYTVYINDTTNANMATGLTIRQAATADQSVAIKDSGVATGLTNAVTNSVETDDYATVSKFATATGGLMLQALGENAAVTTNLLFESYGGQADTTKSSAGRALIEVYAAQHNGANALAAVAANGNIFAIRGHTVNTVWLADEDGDVWQAGGITVGGDIITDHWLNSLNNTILGSGVMGAGNLTHLAGAEGWYNTAVGNLNLYSNDTGSHDTALGYASLYSNTTGSANTAVGYTSLYLNTTGSNNSSLGYFSLYGNSTGAQNLALGFEAGYGATPANASVADTNMVFIGYRANRSVASATALTDSIAIGAGALVDVSHQAVLGHTTITTTLLRGAVTVGVAGTQQGSLALSGVTSGLVTVAVAAAAGTWTMTLPTAAGGAGEQLTDAAGNGITSWAAAASKREYKNILGEADSIAALDRILGTKVYDFHYKLGEGTQDSNTLYTGPMADEAPWAMHYQGGIINPVNTLGYSILGIQALNNKIEILETRIAELEAKD